MSSALVKNRIAKLILSIPTSVTLLITPWLNFDPINLPKFSIFIIGTCVALAMLLSERPVGFLQNRVALRVAGLLLVALILNLGFHGFSTRQLFGVYGSNFGFLTFLCLLIAFLLFASPFQFEFYRQLLYVLVGVGVVNLLYGIVQVLNLDPVNWNNPYSKTIGTFGNPNFYSSLLGISCVASLSIFLGRKSRIHQVVLGFIFAAMAFMIFVSGSIQGIFVLIAGVFILFYLRFVRNSKKLLKLAFMSTAASIAIFTIMGILNEGPLRGFVFGNSVIARGFYWRAALDMGQNNLMTGLGFDTYLDFYRSYRSEEAANFFGPSAVANSSHNYLLDLLVFGGIPLMLAYLIMLLVSLVSAINLISKVSDFDAVGIGLVATWIGSVLQSLVSPSQLSLAVWVWALSGALIGYSRRLSDRTSNVKLSNSGPLSALAIVFVPLGFGLSILVTYGPLSKDMHFLKAVKSQNAQQIKIAANRWPKEVYYTNYASELFLASGLNDDSLEMAKNSIQFNPNSFNAWRLVSMNPNSSDSYKLRSLNEMRRIDPFFKQ